MSQSPMTCVRCGAVPDDEAVAATTWSFGTERGRVVWTCADCTRENARSIEGKLDSAWW